MKILAHRGYWNDIIPPNSPQAIRAALKHGYGFESDVRDYVGRMVVSHNIADHDSQDAEEVFRWLAEFKDRYCFAINIKADGLKEILKSFIEEYDISNYFLFDMSVPQMIEFRDKGLTYFTRQSEVEPDPIMYEDAAGVWIDGFWSTDWITEELLDKHTANGKKICIVSPDLHQNNDYHSFWEILAGYKIDHSGMMLCTDHPDEAKAFWEMEVKKDVKD